MAVECLVAPELESTAGEILNDTKRRSELSILRRLATWMENQSVCVCVTFVIGLSFAMFLTIVIDPLPRVHDEFSYLLAADALSQFETSASTHPHWEHFESYHVIHQPAYASKYPPAQGLSLALGTWFGHPMIGACLATAFAVATVMWMLIGWIPRSTHLFASLLLATHPGIQIHWGQSYMGGAIALASGALLLGALFKLSNPVKLRYPLLAGIGMSGLLMTRPMEGAVLSALVGLVILARFVIKSEWSIKSFSGRIVLPALLAVGIAVAGLLAYNTSVTGSPTKLPYQIHEELYGWNRLFLWQSPKEKPDYRHNIIEDFYRHDVAKRTTNYATFSSGLKQKTSFAIELEYFFFGSSLVFGLFGLPLLLKNSGCRLAILILVPALLAAFMTPWGNTHYAAPAGSLILLLGFCGLNAIWNQVKIPSTRRLMLVAIVIAHLFWIAKDVDSLKSEYKDSWWVARDDVEKKLKNAPDKDLVFVRYSDRHSFYQEWVYNRFDIDDSEVVWAREMSDEKNKALVDYFSNRRVWVVEPDKEPASLTPLLK